MSLTFESVDGSKLVLRHRNLTLSKEEENRIWEEALDWMIREDRCRDVALEARRDNGAPRFYGLDVRLNFLRKPTAVVDKVVCTRERLEIWLDLTENGEKEKIEMASSLEEDREDRTDRIFDRLVRQTGKTRKEAMP